VPEGATITPTVVAQVIAHPHGGAKAVPPRARLLPFINKIDTAEKLTLARETATLLLNQARVEAVILGAAREPDPAREVHGRVAAIVLAAGRSTRMGTPKQLLTWGQTTLLGEVVNRLSRCAVTEVVAVTGAAREAVEASLRETPARPVFNPDFASSEMARSLQVGLAALPPKTSAVLVALADQPQIEPEIVNSIIQRWRETQAQVVAPYHKGQRGHPMLFDSALWPAIAQLPPTANPREMLRVAAHLERVEVNTDSIFLDLDTPADYARAQPGLV
jgi:molybdenum cofactor cytidylyltransferase